MSYPTEKLREESLIRIMDDAPAVRYALAFFLKVEGWKSVIYENPGAFLRFDDPKEPGCLVLDLRMPSVSGLDLQRLLKKEENPLPVIFLTAHGDIDTAVVAVQDGAVDFLQKPVDEERLLRAIEKACRQHRKALHHGLDEEEAKVLWGSLTERESVIADLVANKLSTRVIAERLGISPRTVDAHRIVINRKLGFKRPNDIAVLRALATGNPV